MRFKKIYAFILLALVATVFGNAQITQTGTINGKVSDDEGQPLPGVTVTAKSPVLILPQLDVITNDKGNFRFIALTPGTYTVTFGLSGFKTLVREGIKVTLGATTTLNVHMEISPIKETILVIGQSPVIDVQKTTMTTSFSKEFLTIIPTERRLLDSIFSMAPGSTKDTYHGSTARDNAFMIDGVNISDPTSGGLLVSYGFDIIEEVSIKAGALPAEHGDARGAVVNVVTKSGGNEFHGQANFYYRNMSTQWDNTKGTPLEGAKSGFDFEYDCAFNLGGPIIKNKLWFFANVNYYNKQDYVFGYPWDKQPINTPVDNQRYYPYAKLSYQIDKKNKLVLSYNHQNILRDHRDASRFFNEDVSLFQNNPTNTFNIQWTGFFGSKFFMSSKLAYVTHVLSFLTKNDSIQIYDLDTLLRSGSYGYDNIYKRPQLEFVTDATYFVDDWGGTHEFKGGFQLLYGWATQTKKHNLDPITGLSHRLYISDGLPDYIHHYEDFSEKEQVIRVGGFIQDSWSPTERLSLNLGFRIDHQEAIIPEQGIDREPIVYKGVTYDSRVTNGFKPVIWNTFSPRLGAAYALTGDNKTVLKVSFNRYYATIISQWFKAVNPNSYTSWKQKLNPDGTLLGDPYSFSSSAVATMDPDLKNPYIDEFIAGIEREIMRDTKLSLRYIRKWDRSLVENVDTNALDVEALKSGEFLWTNYQTFGTVDSYDGQPVTFWGVIDKTIPTMIYVTSPPQAKRDYDAVEVVLNKRFSNGWQMNASYVRAYSRGIFGSSSGDSGGGTSLFNDPNAHINVDGLDPIIAPHQFKLQGSCRVPWGINVSGYFYYFAGTPYTRRIRSRDLGLSLPQGTVTIFAEEKGSSRFPDQKILDLRIEKVFNLPGKIGELGFVVDCFNVFNSNVTTGIESLSSNPLYTFGQTTAIYRPRMLRLGVRFQF